jgi:large subunit ribosomal protein L22
MPAPMGRAFRVRKRSNHITIVVAQREQAKSIAVKAKVSADLKKADVKKSETATTTKKETES